MTIPKSQIGNTSLWIPRLGFGCGPIGGTKPGMTNADARATLEAAWDEDIRHFDTAPWYGNTNSEHRVGDFLREKVRDEFTVTSKVGRLYSRPDKDFKFEQSHWRKRWPSGLPFVPHFDFRGDAILRSYEDSLARLGLPCIDGLAIHDLDIRHQKTEKGVALGFEQLESGGGYRALCRLKEEKEIKAIGAGINFAGLIPQFLERFDLDYFMLATPYTLLDQQALDYELPLCAERNVSVLIGAPFASGILATGAIPNAQYCYAEANANILAKVRIIEGVCEKYNVQLPAAALLFPLAHPAVASIVPGAENAEQVRANCTAFSSSVPAEFWTELKELEILNGDAPVP